MYSVFLYLVILFFGMQIARSTVLTFEIKGGDPFGYTQIPQAYGDNVDFIEDAVGRYEVGRGWTKHVKVKYESIDYPGNSLNYFGYSGVYGSFKHSAFTWGAGGIITLTPDPGYRVRLNSLQLAAYLQDQTAEVKVYDKNNSLYLEAHPLVPFQGKIKIKESSEKWVDGSIKIYVKSLYNISISNIDFDERPIPDLNFDLGATIRNIESGLKEEHIVELLNDIPSGKQCRLVFDARLHWPTYSGSSSLLHVYLSNSVDKGLTDPLLPRIYNPGKEDLLNKADDFITRNLNDWTWVGGASGIWRLLFTPGFDVDDVAESLNDYGYGIPNQLSHPYHFEINLTPYVKKGVNRIRIKNHGLSSYPIIIKNVSVEISDPLPSIAEVVYPAPTGNLINYITKPVVAPEFSVYLNSYGDIKYMIDGKEIITKSKSSNPGGGWTTSSSVINGWLPVAKGATVAASWSSSGSTLYRIDRFVKNAGDHIEVVDRYRNQSNSLLGLIIEHETTFPSDLGIPQYYLAGSEVKLTNSSAVNYRRSPGNPTSMVYYSAIGKTAGLFADGDIFRVHCQNFVKNNAIGLSDYELGIPKGDNSTSWRYLEWRIYPLREGDYWSMINQIRHTIGSNYEIPGPIVFSGQDGTKTAEYYKNWVQKRGVKWVCSGQAAFTLMEQSQLFSGLPYSTRYAYGTAVELAQNWLNQTRNWANKLHSLMPDVKVLTYMHPQICTKPETFNSTYSGLDDSKVFDASGQQIVYPIDAPLREYFSTASNSYGRQFTQTYQSMMTTLNLGLDGMNCDEFSYSGVETAFLDGLENNWDGCTALIDGSNFQFIKKTTKASLLQLEHRSSMIDYFKNNNRPFVFSGPSETRTILAKKVPSYAESLSYHSLSTMHLSSPLAYGNHDMTQNDRARSKMVREMLGKGCLLLPWIWSDEPIGQHYIPLMYPITPIELREGMVIGKERIISNKSGIYGWVEGYDANVYVFNGNGQQIVNPDVVKAGGQWSVRMPSDHFVILVRK